jgi:hypothetical protein
MSVFIKIKDDYINPDAIIMFESYKLRDQYCYKILLSNGRAINVYKKDGDKILKKIPTPRRVAK